MTVRSLWRCIPFSDIICTMKRTCVALTALCVVLYASLPAYSQESREMGETVFAPYPSRIRIGIREDQIIIRWEDSRDVVAGYAVYRHKEFPTEDNFGGAEILGMAESGATGFSYKPGTYDPYYYFVLGRVEPDKVTAGETEYRLFIPLRNVSMDAVALTRPAPPAEPPKPAAPVKPSLSGILARADGDSVVVSIDHTGDIGRLVIYRSTSAMTNASSLLEAAIATITEPESGPYRDYPVPGVEYYYAVVPEQQLISGTVSLAAGVNVTREPVSLQVGVYRIGLPKASAASRSMPLPYLVLTKGFADAKPIDAEAGTPLVRTLSAETEKSVASILAVQGSATRAGRPPLTLYPEDLQSSGGGEEYALRTIVSGPFSRGEYQEASREFTLYLSLPRSEKNAARARFYRGQSYALSGAHREAFFDMLQSQTYYYQESSAWIDYILEQLRR